MSITVVGSVGTCDQPPTRYFNHVQARLSAAGGSYVGYLSHPELADVVREHDIVMVPSLAPEGWGLVVLEAMASGCAVTASDRGALPEACGKAGLLVDPTDCGAVVDRLRTLLHAGVLERQKMLAVERAQKCSSVGGACAGSGARSAGACAVASPDAR